MYIYQVRLIMKATLASYSPSVFIETVDAQVLPTCTLSLQIERTIDGTWNHFGFWSTGGTWISPSPRQWQPRSHVPPVLCETTHSRTSLHRGGPNATSDEVIPQEKHYQGTAAIRHCAKFEFNSKERHKMNTCLDHEHTSHQPILQNQPTKADVPLGFQNTDYEICTSHFSCKNFPIKAAFKEEGLFWPTVPGSSPCW